jgi:hypothetical protein
MVISRALRRYFAIAYPTALFIMHLLTAAFTLSLVSLPVLGQYSIWDIVGFVSIQVDFISPSLRLQWQTTWDRSKLLTSLAPSTPYNFGTPGAIGQADIIVDDSTIYQQIDGFGGSLSGFDIYDRTNTY